jgi:quercetin dioxygenase-like cupin family protein
MMNQAYERPFRPTEITDSTATSFSLLSMANQLMTEDAFEKTGRNSLSLARGNNLTVVLMVLKDQAILHEHTAPGPITVTALSGHLEFSTAPESVPLMMMTGDAAVCAAHLPHSVKALEDSVFLIVIGGRVD